MAAGDGPACGRTGLNRALLATCAQVAREPLQLGRCVPLSDGCLFGSHPKHDFPDMVPVPVKVDHRILLAKDGRDFFVQAGIIPAIGLSDDDAAVTAQQAQTPCHRPARNSARQDPHRRPRQRRRHRVGDRARAGFGMA
jgi:hypothetical protein